MAAVFLLTTNACDKVRTDYLDEETADLLTETAEGLVLGEKLENPYSMAVMRRALESLRAQGYDVPKSIEPNCLYVRLTCVDSLAAKAIEENELELYEYPIDYEVLSAGTYEPDDNSTPPTFYAKADIGYTPPSGISMEILDECFVPENAIATKSGNDWESLLENTAVALVGDTPMTTTKGEPVMPKGTIRFLNTARDLYRDYDTEEPLKGVRVRLNYFLKSQTIYTDAEGVWRSNHRFPSAPTVSIRFKNIKGFRIHNGLNVFGFAGTTLEKEWTGNDILIQPENRIWFQCIINNAGYDWYEHCKNNNIATPPDNLLVMYFKGSANSHEANGSAPMLRHLNYIKFTSDSKILSTIANIFAIPYSVYELKKYGWIVPDIIFNKGYYQEEHYYNVYYHTIHEFSHASHFSIVGKDYWAKVAGAFLTNGFGYGNKDGENAKLISLVESWAYATENYLQMQECRIPGYYMNGRFNTGEGLDTNFLTDILQKEILAHGEVFRCYSRNITSTEELCTNMKSNYPQQKERIQFYWNEWHDY